MSNILGGKLAYKGEPGFSAYEIAVKNGFKGSEKEWLATLGTTNHFEQSKSTYIVEEVNISKIPIPQAYIDGSSFLDVYINGQRINGLEYTLNLDERVIELINPLNSLGTVVEMVMVTISTNELPIIETIDETSDNNTTPGTKAVFNFVNNKIASKVDVNSFCVLHGTIPAMEKNTSINVSIDYPQKFNKSNTIIISKNVIKEGILIDSIDSENVLGPIVSGIRLTDDNIIVEAKLDNVEMQNATEFNLVLMKVGE